MLADPKSQALTDNFAAQWLNLRMIPSLDPDPKTYPNFDLALKAAMVTETELYFEHIAKYDRSVLEVPIQIGLLSTIAWPRTMGSRA